MSLRNRFARPRLALLLVLALPIVAGCSGGGEKVLYIGGIPDQDVSLLEARFDRLADYLSEELGFDVEYIPSVSYAAVVTGFKNGDIQLGWYGGLTGVQARLATPGSRAVAHRPRDAEFRSVFVADPALGLRGLEEVEGLTFTFGSESSTSGHLMPRSFLTEAGVDPDADLNGPPSYSGSHDKTWKLVESGAFQAGALSEAVWQVRVEAGDVDLAKVDVFFRTTSYFDYHWVMRGDVDAGFGDGTSARIREALLVIDVSRGERERAIAEAFQTDRFVETADENYRAIEEVAVELGIIRR